MRSGQLVSNVATAVGANVWLTVVALLTMPYVLGGLGRSAYGVFAMVSLVSSHLSNLELGFGQATIRFLARARAAGDEDRVHGILDTALAVFVAAGLAGGTVFLVGSTYLASSFFVIPTGLQPDAITAFRLGAFILTCSFLVSLFSSVLQALGRLAWFNVYRTLAGTTASVASVVAIMLGTGLTGVFLAQAAISLLSVGVLWWAVVRAHGRAIHLRPQRAHLREMGTFGILAFAAGVAYQWMINGPPLVLSTRVEAAVLPAFTVPHIVVQRFAALASSVSLVFFPFASAASVGEDRSHLSAVFQSNLRLTLLVMGPVAAYLTVFGEALLGAWVSPEFARDATPCLRVLAPAALMLAAASPAADVARALGRPGWVLFYTAGVALIAIVTSFVLIPGYGAVGAALALLIALTTGFFPLTVAVATRLFALRPAAIFERLLSPLVAVVALAAAYEIGRAANDSFSSAMVTGAAATAAYTAVSYFLLLETRERGALRRAAGLS